MKTRSARWACLATVVLLLLGLCRSAFATDEAISLSAWPENLWVSLDPANIYGDQGVASYYPNLGYNRYYPSVADYTRGVLAEELLFGWRNTPEFLNAYKAFAIAARNVLLNAYWRHGLAGRNYDIYRGTTDPTDPGMTQVDNHDYDPDWANPRDAAADPVTAQIVANYSTFPEREIEPFFNTLFFSRLNSRTVTFKNEEVNTPYYNPYLRNTLDDISGIPIESGTGHGVGMSQYGAMHLSRYEGQTCQQILRHYYHPSPPFVERVRVVEDAPQPRTVQDSRVLDDFGSGGSTRFFSPGGPSPFAAATAMNDLIVSVAFSEEMLQSTVEVEVERSDGGRVRIDDGLSYASRVWTGKIPKTEIPALGPGSHGIFIRGRHRYATTWWLDRTPLTVSFDGSASPAIYDQGEDANHSFKVKDVAPKMQAPDPPEKNAAIFGADGEALVTWLPAIENEDGSDLTDLIGYRIHYAVGASSPMDGEVVEVEAPTVSRRLDLQNDKFYSVCVTAVDSVGNESVCSNIVAVEPSRGPWVQPGTDLRGSYPTISDALLHATSGSTVIVGPGVYEEASIIVGADNGLDWNPLDIWLVSERGPAETKIITGQIEVCDKCRVIGFTVAEAGQALNILFDKGVLVANNIFLGNGTAISSGGMGGWPRTAETANRIYNNVFAGNVTGINLHFNYNLTDIQNNLFEGTDQDHVGIMFNGCGDTYIRHNNFNGSGSSISDEHPCALIGSNSTCAPQFEDFNAFNLLASDFHLEPGDSCTEDTGATNLRYEGEPWEDCAEFGDNGYEADLGAYGGPFAYVDKNLNGIPDCSEPKGWSFGVAVLKNSTNQPVTLAARNMDTEGMSFSVAEATAHGDLAGAAPHLSYTVTPEYVGPDSLSFTVANTLGESAPEQVSITVKEAHHVCVTRA